MKANRGLIKFILLSLITFGIYDIIFFSAIGEDLNILAPDDKKTMHFCLIFFLLGPITFEIATIVWFHKMSGKIGRTLKARGIDYSFGASTFWIFEVLLSFTIICPFIYFAKLCKSMNLLVEDYNNNK